MNIYLNGLTKLYSFDISGSHLNSFPSIFDCPSLTSIFLKNINFEESSSVSLGDFNDYQGSSLTSLKFFYFQNCSGLKIIELINFPFLNTISVRNSGIEVLGLKGVNTNDQVCDLRIDASCNDISSFSFNGSSILRLNLEGNSNLVDLNLPSQVNELKLPKSLIFDQNNNKLKCAYKNASYLSIKKDLFVKNPIFFESKMNILEDISKEISSIDSEEERSFVLDIISNNPVLSVKQAIDYYNKFNNN